jgi:hypothetical protein
LTKFLSRLLIERVTCNIWKILAPLTMHEEIFSLCKSRLSMLIWICAASVLLVSQMAILYIWNALIPNSLTKAAQTEEKKREDFM